MSMEVAYEKDCYACTFALLCGYVEVPEWGTYHGFKIEVQENICCFNVTMDNLRMTCKEID